MNVCDTLSLRSVRGGGSPKDQNLVNGPFLGTFVLRVGVRSGNGLLYYEAMSDCMSLLFHNKNSNYIRMLNIELLMIDNNKAPDLVREFAL